MTRVGLAIVAASLASLAASSAVSRAQAPDPFEQAEQAYLAVDFERTAELAQRALRRGGLSHARLVRVYELLGVALAATGDEESARDAYVRMLAIDPDAQVDTNLSPRLRSPFMEARGVWATRSEHLGAEVRLVRARGALRVVITDPIDMVDEVRVLTRRAGSYDELQESRAPAAPGVLVEVESLPEADRIEYALELLDEYGNQLLELGSEDEPNVIGRPATSVSPELAPAEGEQQGAGGGSRVWLWILAGVVVVGAAAGVGLWLGLREPQIDLQGGVSFR